MSLAGLLPKPTHSKSKWDSADEDSDDEDNALVAQTTKVPKYGQRKGWIPRNTQDFGTGGAFPEIHVAQYPLGMGASDSVGGQIVPVTLDSKGNVQYDQLLRQGTHKDKIIHSTYDALVPVQITNNDPKRELPDEDEVAKQTEKTKRALGLLVEESIAAAQTSRVAKQGLEPTFIRYTSAQQGEAFNAGAKQRVIRMVNVQNDPMEPPKFKTNKKIPRGPPSPPAPVMHSPPRKVTAEEQSDWKIPPCISSWKNAKGYTIPLDKRLAADGRGLQDVHISDQFAKFSEALFIAERESRVAIDSRRKIQEKAASREKDRKEEGLRKMAEMAREERAGIKPTEEEEEEVRERDQIRSERARERERERRIAAAAPDKRDRLKRNRERDVSEQIALGLPATNVGGGGVDSRLYNQSQGMSSGFNAEDSYDVYDKPFRGEQASSIYRPTKSKDTEYTEEDLDKLKSSERFHKADKGFSGADGRHKRDGPVQFEKAQDDIFGGLNEFFNEAKEKGKKRLGESDDRDNKRRK